MKNFHQHILLLLALCTVIFLPSATSAEPSNSCIGENGKITWHIWNGLRYNGMQDLYNNPYYPTTPDGEQALQQLQSPISYNNLFGAVIRGFIKPSVSGNHTFNLTGDREGIFLLSTNQQPNNLVERCSFSEETEIDEHNKFPSQTSVTLNLNANRYYYFEVRYRDEWGTDFAAVYWKTPQHANDWRIVPNINLYEYTCATLCELPNTPCDDGNANTTGDVWDGFCNCVGQPTTRPSNCIGERNEIRTLIWKDLDGFGVDKLYNDPDYPAKPDSIEIVTRLANPLANLGDNSGTKMAALLIPPATGTYTFNVTSDDQSELFLSTNHDPANKTLIASTDRWTRPTEHDKYPNQTSDPVALTKGQYYYLEVNQQNGSGGKHINVWWKSDKTNPDTWQIIEGLYLFDYTCDITCIPEGTPCDDGNANTKNDTYDANCNCVGEPCQGSDCDPPPTYDAFGTCDATDKVSRNPKDSWTSCQKTVSPNPNRGNSHWIQYDFGDIYPITGAHIWNYNVSGQLGKGFRRVAIDYSEDGNNWTQLGTYTWPKANGGNNYTGFDGPDFGGISARYILVTALSNYGNNNCAGFSQIAFNVGSCPDVGMPCDDGNPNTVNDNIDTDCNCIGVGAPINECEVDNITEENVVVRPDNYGARLTISSAGIILPNTKVNYVAGESITLTAGFEVQAGGNFSATILACSNQNIVENPLVNSRATDEEVALSDASTLEQDTASAIDLVEIDLPEKANLKAMPNPTRSWTTFSFELPYETQASICIFTTSGQRVTCLSSNVRFSPGYHTKEFPAQQLAKGIYLVTLRTEQEMITKNFVVVD
ncbi:MAG: PA14 domain-containing protein [Bacteroidota bacterium]